MDTGHHRAWHVSIAGLLIALSAMGCGTWIPPGAQQVTVTGTSTEVRVEPATVRAGDVYFIVEGSSIMVWHSDETSSGGLSDEEVAALARTGDLFHTGSTVLYPGYAGNIYRWTVGAGTYVFLPVATGDRPDDLLMERTELCATDRDACASLPPLSVATLEVLP